MKRIKTSELRTKSVAELEASIVKMRAEQKSTSRAMSLGEMRDISKINHLRKEIARALTIIGEASFDGAHDLSLAKAHDKQGGKEE
jgi:ribosomal protein L29